jgi:cytoskeletal protein RodZ
LEAAAPPDRPAGGLPQPSPGASVPSRGAAPDELRRAREAAGLSLEEIARRTKINRRMLQAIETMNLEHLPVVTYTRGFVMAYAREVGLDADAIASAYLEEVAARAAVDGPAEAPRPESRPEPILQRDARTGLVGWAFIAACAIGLVVYSWSPATREPAAEPAAPMTEPFATPEASPDVVADRAAAHADAVPASPEVLAAPPETFAIELQTTGVCWVSATVDGELVLSRLLPAGTRQTLDVHDSVTLRVGEPGALRYTIGGREGRPLGRPGQPITVRITRATVSEFLFEG